MFCSHSDRRSFRNWFRGAVFLRQSVFKAVWRESWLLGATLTSKGESLHVDIKPMPWGPWRSGGLLTEEPMIGKWLRSLWTVLVTLFW